MGDALRRYIPKGVQVRLDSDQIHWLAELRQVTVLFVKLTGLAYQKDVQLDFQSINQVLHYMQGVIFRYEGMVRQFLVDDKGTVLIAAFGVPPFSHEDDAVRGVRTALDIHSNLKDVMHLKNAIGITTGRAFCGSVGSNKRQEYAMVGDIVNLSARLMYAAEKEHVGLLCDETTMDAAVWTGKLAFESLPAIMVKGKAFPIKIFVPKSTSETSTTAAATPAVPSVASANSSRGGMCSWRSHI